METFKKILEKFSKKKTKMRFLKQSHSAEKLERGDPLTFGLQFTAKYQKIEGGPFGDKKNSKKSRTVPKTIERVAQCRKKLLEKVSG